MTGPPEDAPEGRRPSGGAYEWLHRGRALLAAGDAQAAATVLRHAYDDEPASPDVLETLARAEFESGRFEEARRLFTALVEREPGSDYARFGLGASLVRLARTREAEPHLALAVAMRPDRAEYVTLLDRARASLGRTRAAGQGDGSRTAATTRSTPGSTGSTGSTSTDGTTGTTGTTRTDTQTQQRAERHPDGTTEDTP